MKRLEYEMILYLIIQIVNKKMLSKEEKLKYGEMLRQQMKEKEEKKKNQQLQKRGFKKPPTQPKIYPEKENHTLSNQKQALQRQFENVDYGPFGRPGGGAPVRSFEPKHQQETYQVQYPPQQYASRQLPNENPQGRVKTQQPEYHVQTQEYNNHQTINGQQPNYPPQQYLRHPEQYQQNYPSHRKVPNEQYLQYRTPVQSHQQIPSSYEQYPPQRNFQNIPSDQPLIPTYGNAYQLQPPQQQRYQQPYQQKPVKQEEYAAYKQNEVYQKPYEETYEQKQKRVENEQLMQIHKKGGRNLLQLENMTAEQQLIKQKQKIEMQKQLKLQMEEADRRKREEKERRQRQEREEEIKNQQYFQREKQKILDEERKKNEKQKQLYEQNKRSQEERKKFDEEAKIKAQLKNKSFEKSVSPPQQPQKETFTRQAQIQFSNEQTESQGSSSTIMQRAFNTDVSKEFFQRERKRDQERYNRQKNLQSVTDEIKKMRDQMDKQNDMFKRQIQKMRQESGMAEMQKRRAENQIQRLKDELKQKEEDDNERLFMALQRQQKMKNQSEYELPSNKIPRKSEPAYMNEYENEQSIPRARKNEHLVKKKYVVPPEMERQEKYNASLEQSNVSENGLQSLHGVSKKIPLNIDDPKLSMSKLSDYARETQYFKNPQTTKKKSSYQIQESIVEEEEERMQSRKAGRNQYDKLKSQEDELDRLMKSRQKSRGGWGEMSSVNQDITKQIEDLLKKKEKQSGKNERPTSHLSNAGRQALSRHGLQYEGQSINTLNTGGNGTLNTLEMDRLQNRNEARLNELRNLGVETINTNNDEEFSKLDEILNKYKQDRSRAS